MKFYYPDGKKNLARTTHLAIGAHQDDLEIMAGHGIIKCYKHASSWFTGVTCTSGAGSPRQGKYARLNDQQMLELRAKEQERAAKIGKYAAVAQLGLSSGQVKNEDVLVPRLRDLIEKCRPRVIYTHNLADKHATHVAVAKQVIETVRQLNYSLEGFYGCEVWRGLDWLNDSDKIAFDLSGHQTLISKLLGVYKSQIAGGKGYDQATIGRMRANATYFESHSTDRATHLWFAMDYKPLIDDPNLSIRDFLAAKGKMFCDDLMLLV